jgi:hypothetical protein
MQRGRSGQQPVQSRQFKCRGPKEERPVLQKGAAAQRLDFAVIRTHVYSISFASGGCQIDLMTTPSIIPETLRCLTPAGAESRAR